MHRVISQFNLSRSSFQGELKKDSPGDLKKDSPGDLKKDSPGDLKKDSPGDLRKGSLYVVTINCKACYANKREYNYTLLKDNIVNSVKKIMENHTSQTTTKDIIIAISSDNLFLSAFKPKYDDKDEYYSTECYSYNRVVFNQEEGGVIDLNTLEENGYSVTEKDEDYLATPITTLVNKIQWFTKLVAIPSNRCSTSTIEPIAPTEVCPV